MTELQTIGPDQYRCEACGGVFTKGVSDVEALDKLRDTFPGFEIDECVLVCDDCYKEMVTA